MTPQILPEDETGSPSAKDSSRSTSRRSAGSEEMISIADQRSVDRTPEPDTTVNKIKRKMSPTKLKILLATIFVIIALVNHFANRVGQGTGPREIYTDRPMRHVPLNLVYKEQSEPLDDLSLEFEESRPAFMINTPGCKIPMILEQHNETKNIDNATCGERAVFLKRYDSDFVQVTIEDKALRKLIAKDYEYRCCYYQFTSDQNGTKETECQDIRDGYMIRLEYDFIGVKCFEFFTNSEEEKLVYEDVYAFVKTIGFYGSTCSNKFNVLIIGVNSMSLSKFAQTMPRTVNFFKDNNWLAFRGYHKLSDTNKIANLMTAFIGHDVYMGTEKCSFVTELCHDPIWKTFEKVAYVTAIGEDYVRHPDSINKQYSFMDATTYHYTYPLFQAHEREIHDQKLVCTGKRSSAQQLLDYAYDFALAYRQTPFFGFFWMNSFSKYVEHYRENADKMLEDFFTRLTYTGILKNTFLILVSDHGLQKQERPLTLEAFYDNQSPAFLMYVPEEFRWKFAKKPMTLKINQFRLVTPFDLYDTLYHISEIAKCKRSAPGMKITESHQSLLDAVSEKRTCEKLGIDFEWCNCNRLYSLEKVLPSNLESIKSVQLVQDYLQKRIRSIITVNCTSCSPLAIKNVTSLYYMINREKGYLYHHMSFSTTVDGLSYDATVCEQGSQLRFINAKTVQPLSKDFGNCTSDPNDHMYCVCQKRPECDGV